MPKTSTQSVFQQLLNAALNKNFMLYVFAFYAFTYAMRLVERLLYVPLPESNQRLADVVLGSILTVIIVTIINFIFGSSKSSADKSEQIEELIVQVTRKNKSESVTSTETQTNQSAPVEQLGS